MSRIEEQQKSLPAAGAPPCPWLRVTVAVVTLCLAEVSAADGTPAGTVIDNAAEVEFDVNGSRTRISSNTVSVTVDERIDVVVTALSPEVIVAPGETGRAALFSITNTGNGSETFSLLIGNALSGDDFDPVAAEPPIYFDSDGSGDLSVGDQPYVSGSNDPVLDPDESVTILVVNDIPVLPDGSRGRSEVQANAVTGSGAPGTAIAGAGDGGVNALMGASGGSATAVAEYLVSGVTVDVSKSVTVLDPFGGSAPIPGATLTYTVMIQVTDDGTAADSTFTDPIPENTTFVPASLSLNGSSLTDAADADAGEFNAGATPEVRVALGDLTQASGLQTVAFDVTID